MKDNVVIRKALKADVPFVAECVLAAMDMYDFGADRSGLDVAQTICGREDTLYSYRNALVAEVDGTAAACLVAYDGGTYAERRRITFAMLEELGVDVGRTENETGPGEYYLDSMAVRPAFRGRGLGLVLLRNAIDYAADGSFSSATLIVDCGKPRLREYYAGLGFRPESRLQAFGSLFDKMLLPLG